MNSIARSPFIWVCCQVGAEQTLKNELIHHHPGLRFAFSRPGFLTFKVVESELASDNLDLARLNSPFARAAGHSLGRVALEQEGVSKMLGSLPDHTFRHLHVWPRHRQVPGERGFEPFHDQHHLQVAKQIKEFAAVRVSTVDVTSFPINRTAKPGEWIVDCIVVDDETWWLGYHQAVTVASSWPGGIPILQPNSDVISRAYWKMEEALKWSRLPIRPGDRCIEIGSAPGGSCQCLLARGLLVTGLDPAKMDIRLLENPNFTHVQARADDLKRREFSQTPWLVSDANTDPVTALDSIEAIVTNRRVHVKGMLITLKLASWDTAGALDEHMSRIRSWGFRHVRARQLAFNRREVCVLAVRRKHLLRGRHARTAAI